eukprot:TRINITY_DN7860_c0_g1_i11.p8 TRINITY_DN7860_c0_g1~~TRINITY_DN7860_c0_g1_i11.p8  ORF type:complete len:121 (+),score=30.00 TRINITY_DN7860_c0_g1_i11:2131-2493(+)
MSHLLEFMYGIAILFESWEQARDVAVLADEYLCADLKKYCERELMARLDVDTALESLVVADAIHMNTLREASRTVLVAHFEDLDKTDKFDELMIPERVHLLKEVRAQHREKQSLKRKDRG